MRIWNVSPASMCRRHLLGEHVEMHMIVGSLRRGKNLDGFYSRGLIDTRLIRARHDELAAEAQRRGYSHASPLPDFVDPRRGFITSRALEDLRGRCLECRKLL